MITLSIILALSFAVLSLALFLSAAFYWFPLWRRKKVGIAHCLFLTNVFLAIISFLKLVQIASFVFNNADGSRPFSLIIGFVVLGVAVTQFALSRGYFTVQE